MNERRRRRTEGKDEREGRKVGMREMDEGEEEVEGGERGGWKRGAGGGRK